MRVLTSVVIALVMAMGVAAPAQRAGTGVIAGRLIAADTGRPVRFARVSLAGLAENVGAMIVTTDDQGSFSFIGLSAASYLLSASKTGFLTVKYGEKTPGFGRSGTLIQLADGQRLDRLTLAIPRGGALAGVLIDDAGDPAYGTSVRALRYVMQSGVRTLLLAGTGVADDRGAYRISALPPGDYVVTATPNPPSPLSSAGDFAMQAEMGRVIDAAKAAARQDPALAATLRSLLPADSERATGYVPVYFPGTTTFSAASTIALGVSEERTGVDLQLQMVPMARVSGIVIDPNGSVPRAEIDLVAVGAGGGATSAGMPAFNETLGPDGRFSFDGVAPGQYTLSVRTRTTPVAGKSGLSRWARQEVAVGGSNVTDVTLTLQPSLKVSGVVVFDGPAPISTGHMGVSFTSAGEPHNMTELGSWEVGEVSEGLRFTTLDLVPARYHVTVTPLPPGWMLVSAMFGGRDALDFPLELKPAEAPPSGVLTLSQRQTELSGTLVDQAGAPTSAYTVVVFSTDTRYWTPDSRRVQAVRPPASGGFSFKNLPPGSYRLAAATDVEYGEWFDPAFLRELAGVAMTATIGEGEKKRQDLRIR